MLGQRMRDPPSLFSPVPRLGKLHRHAIREEPGTQDRQPHVHEASQQAAVRPVEDSNTWGWQYLRTLQAGRVCCCPQTPETTKVYEIGFQHPEFTLHAVSALKSWFHDVLNSCMPQLKIPRIWRRTLVVAIPKPEKPLEDPKTYRPISLLCVPFKILERLIYARVETIMDPLLPHEKAAFRLVRSAVDPVTLLT